MKTVTSDEPTENYHRFPSSLFMHVSVYDFSHPQLNCFWITLSAFINLVSQQQQAAVCTHRTLPALTDKVIDEHLAAKETDNSLRS